MIQHGKDVIWVDQDDNELGIIARDKAHQEGLLHRIAVVYVTNNKGKILVQERMSGRLDHSSAGHVDPGEDYLEAAKREIKEELGIECELSELGKVISNEIEPEGKFHKTHHIFKVYECQNAPKDLAKDEVRSVFWADPKQIFEDMKIDDRNIKYCGGFKKSLEFYLKNKKLV